MAGAFVLGALEPADEAAVRAHLPTCDDAHAEIAELGGVLPALAVSVPQVEPPAGLKARIMAAAAADLEERTARSAAACGCRARAAAPTTAEPAAAEPTAFPSAVGANRAPRADIARVLDPAHRRGRRDRRAGRLEPAAPEPAQRVPGVRAERRRGPRRRRAAGLAHGDPHSGRRDRLRPRGGQRRRHGHPRDAGHGADDGEHGLHGLGHRR